KDPPTTRRPTGKTCFDNRCPRQCAEGRLEKRRNRKTRIHRRTHNFTVSRRDHSLHRLVPFLPHLGTTRPLPINSQARKIRRTSDKTFRRSPGTTCKDLERKMAPTKR